MSEKKCTGCEEKNIDNMASIPFVAHEAAIDREERHTKRWMITCFVLIGIIVSMIIGFLIYESQFETYYYSQDGEGMNNVNIGSQGDVINGTKTPNQAQEEPQN